MNLLPLLDKLLTLSPPIVVVPHENADIDAVASAWGIVRLLRGVSKEAVLCIPTISASAARLLSALGIDYLEECDVRGKSVVVVDTVSADMVPVNLTGARRVVLIDHHPGKHPFDAVVYPCRSCSEIVAEALLTTEDYDRNTLLLLAAGIVADTAGLQGADAHSLFVLSSLLRQADADLSDVLDLIVGRREISERIARLKAMARAEIHRFCDFIVAVSRVDAYEASAATAIIQAGADVAIVYGKKRVSGRMSAYFFKKTGFSLLDVFARVSKVMGCSFGGHPLAAGLAPDDPKRAALLAVDAVSNLLRERGFTCVHRVY